MRLVGKPLLLGCLFLGLGACTTALPPDETPALGGPFNDYLKDGYVSLTSVQRDAFRINDYNHFRGKARSAMLGNTVWPERVSSYAVPAEARDEALVLRARLINLLELGGKTRAPEETATAQVSFDCWLIELSDPSDPPAKANECRQTLLSALEKAEQKTIDPVYYVFFAPGSDQLNLEARNAITTAARASVVAHPMRVEVVGFADPSGDPAANQALSKRRADAVAEALRAAGIKAGEIEVVARGETGDLSKAPESRRVEVSFAG